MISGLRAAGVDVFECHESLWKGIEDRIQAVRGGWLRPEFLLRVLRAYFRLFWRGLHLPDYDILVCGYPGHLDVFLGRLLSFLRRRPFVWDVFMSIYLISLERGLDNQHKISVNLIKWLERIALRLPDLLVQDTQQYVNWLEKTHKIPANRFCLVPTGADDKTFHKLDYQSTSAETFTALYYGTFIPNHGVPYIIQAAHLLKDQERIRFVLVGEGPDMVICRDLVNELGLTRVAFLPWMSQQELLSQIAHSNVVLGAFGKTPQSLMTVQNKIFEGMATAHPVITGSSPATVSAFSHGENIWLCDRDDPGSLAEALKTLSNNPELCSAIGENGYSIFVERYSTRRIGECFKAHLERYLAESKRSVVE